MRYKRENHTVVWTRSLLAGVVAMVAALINISPEEAKAALRSIFNCRAWQRSGQRFGTVRI